REETQLAATIALLNRLEGLPVARNVNLAVDDVSRLSDAELEAALAALQGKSGRKAWSRTTPASVPNRPPLSTHDM
ncbi:MAG: hypothetical protein ABI224_10230, partial [Acetobacteraceae bacterium]